MTVSLIVAMNLNRVIGVNGDLPWRLPDELAYFKLMTRGKPVVMGRKTFESLNCQPLKNRLNVVITRQSDFQCRGCEKASSLQEALRLVQSTYKGEIMVIGGARLYEETVPIASRLYITVVENHILGDVFFPYGLDVLLDEGWKIDQQFRHESDDRHSSAYTCYQLIR